MIAMYDANGDKLEPGDSVMAYIKRNDIDGLEPEVGIIVACNDTVPDSDGWLVLACDMTTILMGEGKHPGVEKRYPITIGEFTKKQIRFMMGEMADILFTAPEFANKRAMMEVLIDE